MTCNQKTTGCAVLIAVYFFALTYRGLGAYFTGDDLTNIQFLHGFGQRPFYMLLVHSAVVVTPEYRPFGGVVYRTLYAIFGLEPLPFRVFAYSCLVLNLTLAGIFFYLIARSRTVAALAALVFAVHTCMDGIYFNTGTLYDILCFTFGISALILYVYTRNNHAPLTGRRLIFFVALYGLALDSKEMAVTWPLLLIAYEGVFHRREKWRRERTIPVALSAGIAVLYGLVKTQVPNEMSITPEYIPRTSLSYAGHQFSYYYSLLLENRAVHLWPLLVGMAVLLLAAIGLRSRAMIFGLLFANIALLPLLVIPERAGFVWYIPWLGWALYAGAFLFRLIELIGGSIRSGNVRTRLRLEYLAGGCFLLLLAGLYIGRRSAAAHMGDALLPQQRALRSLRDAMVRAKPDLGGGSRVLVADDPFGPVDWNELFLIRLAWHDATIWVDRPSQSGAWFDPGDLSAYAVIVNAGASPIQVLPGEPIAQEETAAIGVLPSRVNRGGAVSVAVSGFPGCRVDAEYRLPDDELARSGIWRDWCTLDAAAKCRVRIDQDAERGVVQLRRVRLCVGRWRRVNASFEILP